jgi:hypothetical protein
MILRQLPSAGQARRDQLATWATAHFWALTGVLAAAGAAVGYASGQDEPLDYSLFARAGSHLVHGDLAAVYNRDSNQGGPLELLAAWGFRALTPAGLEVPALRISGAVALVVGTIAAVRSLRDHLALRASPLLALGLGLSIVIWEIPAYPLDGHLAELVIPVAWVAAALAMRSGRPYTAAGLIALSAGVEIWGVLGVACLLQPLPSRHRLPVIAAVCGGGVAALYAPFFLAGSFAGFGHTWPIATSSIWHYVTPAQASFTWWMRLAQGAVAVGAAACAVPLVRTSRHGIWLIPLVVAETRLLLDPLAYPYYYVVPQLLVLAGVAVLDDEPPADMCLLVVLAYVQFVFSPGSRLFLLALSLVAVSWLAWRVRRRDWASTPAGAPAGR